MTLRKKRVRGTPDELYKHHLDMPPEGTKEEHEDAIGKVLEHQLRILDYSDLEEFPDEVLAEQRRLVFYGVRGPRRGYYVSYGRAKLWQADVLYILTVTLPAQKLADKYGVTRILIQRIRSGQESQWQYEWRLIRRLKTAIRHNLRQLNKGTRGLTLYAIKNTRTKEILHLITSLRKAKEYKNSLYGKRNKEYYIEQVEVLT